MKKLERFYSHHPGVGWLIWGLGTLFYAYEFFIQVSPNVIGSDLMKDFNITAGDLGRMGAFYFYAYALMQIPVGMLTDRFGVRKLLTLASIVCAVSCYWFSVAHTLHTLAINRFLMGLGSSFAVVSCLHIASTWLPPKRFAMLTGMMLSIGMLGAVAGEAPLALLVAKIGWRQSMFLLSIAGSVIALLAWLFIGEKPLPSSRHSKETASSVLATAVQVMKNPGSWIVAIYAGFMFIPTPTIGGLWGVPAFMELHHLSRPAAASATSMLFIGWIIGGPLLGWLSDATHRRRLPLMIGSVGTLLSLAMVIYLPHLSLPSLIILLFIVGFFSSGFLPAFSIIREINRPEANATALGFMNGLNSIGAAFSQPLVGWLLDSLWTPSHINKGVRFYSAFDYQIALTLLPACILLSLLLLPWVKETYCRSLFSHTTQDK